MPKQFRHTVSTNPTTEAFYAVARAADAALRGAGSSMESRSWVFRRSLSLMAADAKRAIQRDIRDAAARAGATSKAEIERAMKRRAAEIDSQLKVAFDAMAQDSADFAEHVRPLAEEFLATE